MYDPKSGCAPESEREDREYGAAQYRAHHAALICPLDERIGKTFVIFGVECKYEERDGTQVLVRV